MDTPVALFFFNRPSKTRRVFAEIARARPRRLFLVADGARDDHPEDARRVATCRALVERVDWPCEVRHDYSETNQGCFARLVSGYRWLFEQVEEAIVLEDDCLPDPSFFRFCVELLDHYRDDERVFMIGGRNSLWPERRVPHSYTFCRSLSCWGWAAWQRSWRWFDPTFEDWPALRRTSWLEDLFGHPGLVTFYRWRFDQCRDRAERGLAPSSAYTWVFACLRQGGLEILPAKNLVHNLGFDQTATHPFEESSPLARVPVEALDFPLRHPPEPVWDEECDALRYQQAAALKVARLATSSTHIGTVRDGGGLADDILVGGVRDHARPLVEKSGGLP